jgi:hypothetical protein
MILNLHHLPFTNIKMDCKPKILSIYSANTLTPFIRNPEYDDLLKPTVKMVINGNSSNWDIENDIKNHISMYITWYDPIKYFAKYPLPQKCAKCYRSKKCTYKSGPPITDVMYENLNDCNEYPCLIETIYKDMIENRINDLLVIMVEDIKSQLADSPNQKNVSDWEEIYIVNVPIILLPYVIIQKKNYTINSYDTYYDQRQREIYSVNCSDYIETYFMTTDFTKLTPEEALIKSTELALVHRLCKYYTSRECDESNDTD